MEKNKGKKSRANHAVEEGFAFSIREFTKGMAPECIGMTKRGRLNNSAYFIKRRAKAWADAFPKKIDGTATGFTPAVREVFKAIVWRHLMDRGYSVFSFESLADECRCERTTVWRAINFLRDKGLVQFKTGRGWGQKERRNLANQYVANFWAFINPETGTIIDPPYQTGTYEWAAVSSAYRARLGMAENGENVTTVASVTHGSRRNGEGTGPQLQNATMVEGKNRQESAGPKLHSATVYTDKDKGSPPDDTPSPDGSGAPSSSPKHEMSSFVLPAKKDSAVMRFVEHSMAEWEKIFSPDEPGNQAVALFMAGLHGDDLSAHVSNELAKNYKMGCMDAYDFSLLDEFDEEDNIHLTYTSDVFVIDLTMEAALSNDGKRMMIYSIK